MVERCSPLPYDGTECVVLDVPYNVAQRQTGARERDFVHLAPRNALPSARIACRRRLPVDPVHGRCHHRAVVELIPVSALSDNYVWIAHRRGCRQALAVDPGVAAPVEDALRRNGLELAAVLLTHHHGDHVAGVPELAAATGVPVYGPATEPIPSVDRPLTDSDRLEAAGLRLTVLAVPGHTAGHIAYHGEGLLFSGDTLFGGGCGRLFEGTPEEMVNSLSRLAALDVRTAVCCGHEYTVANLRFASQVEAGNQDLLDRLSVAERLRSGGVPTLPSTIGLELRTNPFLRCTAPAVVEAVHGRAGRALPSAVDVFAELRRWKDGWRDSSLYVER